MKPSPEMLREIDTIRADHQVEVEQRTEQEDAVPAEQERHAAIVQQCVDAREIAEKTAHDTGGNAYLGGDALSKNYTSDWITIGSLDDKPGVAIQAQLERSYGIPREGKIIGDAQYRHTTISVRLLDEASSNATREERFGRFERDMVMVIDDSVWVAIRPENEKWQELDEILRAFEA